MNRKRGYDRSRDFAPGAMVWIYVIQCQEFYKIGIASDIPTRLKGIQSSNPFEVTLSFAREVPHEHAAWAESRAHQELAVKRVRGEWFACTKAEAHNAVSKATSQGRQRKLPDLPPDHEFYEYAESLKAQKAQAAQDFWDVMRLTDLRPEAKTNALRVAARLENKGQGVD